MHGYKFLPSEMPPSFVAQPWNNMPLIIRKKGASSTWQVKVSDVLIALRAQAGFTNVPSTESKDAVHFEIRIKGISVWETGGLAFALMPMDILNVGSELCRIDSNPQRNMFARAGYQYPLAHTSITLSTFTKSSTLLFTLLGGSTYEVHLSLVWKGADSSLPQLEFVYPSPRRRLHELIEELKTLQLQEAMSDASSFTEVEDPL